MSVGAIPSTLEGYNYPLLPQDRSQTPAESRSRDEDSPSWRDSAESGRALGQDPSASTPRPVSQPSESAPADQHGRQGGDASGSEQEGESGHGLTLKGCICNQSPCICSSSAGGREMDSKEEAELRQLQQRDREVRAHEHAHAAAGGRYVRGGAQYEYKTGPDGKRYANGGEVSIDCSKENTPQATIQKARTIKRAALAPAKPSAQDRQVAAKAAQMEREAQAELAEQKQEEAKRAAEDEGRKQGAAGAGELFPAPSASRVMPFNLRLRPFSAQV